MKEFIKKISYDRITKDFAVYINGELIGFEPTMLAGEARANEYVRQALEAAGRADASHLTDEEAGAVLAAVHGVEVTAELVELERAAGVDEAQPARQDVRAHTSPAAPRGRSQKAITAQALQTALDSFGRQWRAAIARGDQVKADEIEEQESRARRRYARLFGMAA